MFQLPNMYCIKLLALIAAMAQQGVFAIKVEQQLSNEYDPDDEPSIYSSFPPGDELGQQE